MSFVMPKLSDAEMMMDFGNTRASLIAITQPISLSEDISAGRNLVSNITNGISADKSFGLA